MTIIHKANLQPTCLKSIKRKIEVNLSRIFVAATNSGFEIHIPKGKHNATVSSRVLKGTVLKSVARVLTPRVLFSKKDIHFKTQCVMLGRYA
jgi:hypothetical protein